jgi:thiol-disulfide isomerase/thioredoxin
MNTDNLSALAVGVAVVALIVGFAIYFNSPELNKNASGQQPTEFVSSVGESGDIVRIDKSQYKQAPELSRITGYVNSEPFKLSDLKGKVVVVDFWTYSCINCIRTIPYLNMWYEKYADDGLVIVGVHTPEFEFEKNPDNVRAAVEKYGIKYPVVQDNERGTWKAYENRYWPRKYIVDDEGYIRYDHIGEGGYAETEYVIQSLLRERAANLGQTINVDSSITRPESVQNVEFSRIHTPELYFGYVYARAPLGNPEGYRPDQVVKYTIPEDVKPNAIYLSGEWKNNSDHMELKGQAGQIILEYSAKSVNIVAGGAGKISVSEDGSALTEESLGTDLSENGSTAIDGQRLYNIITHSRYGEHRLIIDVVGEGFQIYTFTFG